MIYIFFLKKPWNIQHYFMYTVITCKHESFVNKQTEVLTSKRETRRFHGSTETLRAHGGNKRKCRIARTHAEVLNRFERRIRCWRESALYSLFLYGTGIVPVFTVISVSHRKRVRNIVAEPASVCFCSSPDVLTRVTTRVSKLVNNAHAHATVA